MKFEGVYTEEDVRDAYTIGYSWGLQYGKGMGVVHGRWEKFTLGTYDFALRLRCSMCQKVVYEEEFKFCPYCGARMDDG